MDDPSLKQIFQHEFSKIVAVISKQFGLRHIELAEDIVSETFLQAAETWGVKGIPPNPRAWLYVVAKQKTVYHFRRSKIFENKVIPEIASRSEYPQEITDLNFSPENIKDSQLQMLFAVCNPLIASEAQIGLALRILCGFGIDEIAEAFLTNKETINKRLFRAKEKLRTEKVSIDFPSETEIELRLDNVLHVIYLLFNEGYYSKTQNQILQKELCVEAMRLCSMLIEFERTNLPKTNALFALMCFHASRFDARQTTGQSMILYEQQDEALWNKDMILQGIHFMNLSARGNEISSYHLEARIAYWHCIKVDTREKWLDILRLYDQLLIINYSPSVLLSRVYALYKARGRQVALEEAEKLNFENNHFYHILLGELYSHTDKLKAKMNYQRAQALAKTNTEREAIQIKIESIDL